MTSHMSEREREQVVIDLENLKTISVLGPKNMGPLPQEIDLLLASASHFISRFLCACASYARAPSLGFMNAGHSCVAMLSSIAMRAGVPNNSDNVDHVFRSNSSILTTALYVGLDFLPFYASYPTFRMNVQVSLSILSQVHSPYALLVTTAGTRRYLQVHELAHQLTLDCVQTLVLPSTYWPCPSGIV
jgi:hypothetical protein